MEYQYRTRKNEAGHIPGRELGIVGWLEGVDGDHGGQGKPGNIPRHLLEGLEHGFVVKSAPRPIPANGLVAAIAQALMGSLKLAGEQVRLQEGCSFVGSAVIPNFVTFFENAVENGGIVAQMAADDEERRPHRFDDRRDFLVMGCDRIQEQMGRLIV